MARRMATCGWRDQCGAAIRASGPNRGLRNRSGFHKQSGALTHAHTQYHAAHPVWLLTFWTDHRLRAHHNQHDVLRSVRAGKIQGHNRSAFFLCTPDLRTLPCRPEQTLCLSCVQRAVRQGQARASIARLVGGRSSTMLCRFPGGQTEPTQKVLRRVNANTPPLSLQRACAAALV